MTATDVEALRAQYRESYHRKTAARRAKGLCVTCGLCGVPHKPHDVHFTVMLGNVDVSLSSKGLTANHFT